LAAACIAIVSDGVSVAVASPLVLTRRIGDIEDTMSAVLRSKLCYRLRSFCLLIPRLVGPKAVGIIIRTTVSVFRSVTECVAIAKGAKYRDTAAILPARATVHRWVFCPAVVTRYVPVGVRPRRSSPPQHLHQGDQGEEEEDVGGEGHPAGLVWRVLGAPAFSCQLFLVSTSPLSSFLYCSKVEELLFLFSLNVVLSQSGVI